MPAPAAPVAMPSMDQGSVCGNPMMEMAPAPDCINTKPDMLLETQRLGKSPEAMLENALRLPLSDRHAPRGSLGNLTSRGNLTARGQLTSRGGIKRQEGLDPEEAERRRAMSHCEPFLLRHGFSDIGAERKGVFKTQCPLHAAVREKDATAVRQLLIARADPKSVDSAGRTPLALAEEKNKNGSHIGVLAALRPPASRRAGDESDKNGWGRQRSFIR